MFLLFRKIGLIILCILLFISSHAQTPAGNDSVLYWVQGYRLTFADFQGRPSKEDTTSHTVNAQAITHRLGSITKSIDVRIWSERGKIMFTIYAGMKKTLSWIKVYGDSITLKHEQGHFDICEIYARMLRRDIKSVRSLAEAKELFEQIVADEELEHDRFDKANTFESGGITHDWRNKIIARLKELEPYKNPVVLLLIDK